MTNINLTLEPGLVIQCTGYFSPANPDEGVMTPDFELEEITACNDIHALVLWIEQNSLRQLIERIINHLK